MEIVLGTLAVVLVALILVMWQSLLKKLDAIEVRLLRMERLQQRVAEKHGVLAAGPGLEPVLALLMGRGRQRRRIAAIRDYRRITGVGLAEAKDAVDRLDRGEPA